MIFLSVLSVLFYLLVYHLTITVFYSWAYSLIIHHDHYNYITMPVITRSQARTLTGSKLDLSTFNSTLIGTSSAPSCSETLYLENNLSQASSTIVATKINNLSDSSPSLILSNPSSMVPDQQLEVFQNLEFSKCTDFAISTSSSIKPSSRCHNLFSSTYFTMESDCEETNLKSNNTQETVDITRLFAQLSSQITSQTTRLQEQIMHNDLKISQDFIQVVQAHDNFKQEVREELDKMILSRNTTMVPSLFPILRSLCRVLQ